MAAREIHQYDIGTTFRFTIKDDDEVYPLDDATILKYKFYKPSSAVVEKTALLYTDGTDGKLQYITTTNDLDETGVWRLQAYIENPSWKGHTDIWEFYVYENLS